MKNNITIILALTMSGCVVYHERDGEHGGALASVAIMGTDANSIRIITPSGGGIEAEGLEQSESVRHIGRAVVGWATVKGLADVALAREATTRHAAEQATTRALASEQTSRAAITATQETAGALGGVVDADPTLIKEIGRLFK